MKIVKRPCEHKTCNVVLRNQMVKVWISHEETWIPTHSDSDFAEESVWLIGFTEPIKPMSLMDKRFTHICIPKQSALFK